MQDEIRSLVAKLGGPLNLAQELRASHGSVRMWAKLGRIPWKWRHVVRALVRARRIFLTRAEWQALALEPEPEALDGRRRRKELA